MFVTGFFFSDFFTGLLNSRYLISLPLWPVNTILTLKSFKLYIYIYPDNVPAAIVTPSIKKLKQDTGSCADIYFTSFFSETSKNIIFLSNPAEHSKNSFVGENATP